MVNFRPIDRATPFLLPPAVEDWLPKDHLARFVVDIVDQLETVEFFHGLGRHLIKCGTFHEQRSLFIIEILTLLEPFQERLVLRAISLTQHTTHKAIMHLRSNPIGKLVR